MFNAQNLPRVKLSWLNCEFKCMNILICLSRSVNLYANQLRINYFLQKKVKRVRSTNSIFNSLHSSSLLVSIQLFAWFWFLNDCWTNSIQLERFTNTLIFILAFWLFVHRWMLAMAHLCCLCNVLFVDLKYLMHGSYHVTSTFYHECISSIIVS